MKGAPQQFFFHVVLQLIDREPPTRLSKKVLECQPEAAPCLACSDGSVIGKEKASPTQVMGKVNNYLQIGKYWSGSLGWSGEMGGVKSIV